MKDALMAPMSAASRMIRSIRSGISCGRGGVLLGSWVVGVALLSGCASKNSSMSSEAYAPSAELPSDASVEELEQLLGDEESRLRAAGIGLPASSAALSAGGDSAEAVDVGGQAAPMKESVAAEPSMPEADDGDADYESREPPSRRCENVCDLARSICDLEAHICSLATRHVGDSRYSQVCERASGDCRVAQEACDDCS